MLCKGERDMTEPRRFVQCDVFTASPTRGNALAVVLDADGLSDNQMQQFAAWTNLAETTFIHKPTDKRADYAVRIFTPVKEMPFAGHPTLGSCAAWLHHGGQASEVGIVRQQCAVGIIEIDLKGEVPAFIAPPTAMQNLPESRVKTLCEKLCIDPSAVVDSALLDNGPVWQALYLKSADDVLQANEAAVSYALDKPIGLIGEHPPHKECDYEVRMLAPSSGMSEDPITGSLNAALAHWMLSNGLLKKPVVVAQGTKIGRTGRVFVIPDKNESSVVRIGGQTHVLIDGVVQL